MLLPSEQAVFAAAYREGMGLACIVVRRGAAGVAIAAAPTGAGADKDCAEAIAHWWCRRAADAARIAAAARAALRRRRESSTAPGACSAAGDSQEISFACTTIEGAARRYGVVLFSDDDIAAHAAEITARVDAELQKLKESGDLKSVNQAYKAHRLERSGRGERALRYDEWMRRYRADLVRQAAAALREL
jgi:hypothetical protein